MLSVHPCVKLHTRLEEVDFWWCHPDLYSIPARSFPSRKRELNCWSSLGSLYFLSFLFFSIVCRSCASLDQIWLFAIASFWLLASSGSPKWHFSPTVCVVSDWSARSKWNRIMLACPIKPGSVRTMSLRVANALPSLSDDQHQNHHAKLFPIPNVYDSQKKNVKGSLMKRSGTTL